MPRRGGRRCLKFRFPMQLCNGWTAAKRSQTSTPAAGKSQIDGKITAYVCIGQRCSMPLTEPDLLKEKLKEERHVAVQVAAAPI